MTIEMPTPIAAPDECGQCGMPHDVTHTMLTHAAQITAEHGAQAILVCGGAIPDRSLLDFESGLKTLFLLVGRPDENAAEGDDELRKVIRVPHMPPTRMSQIRMGILLALSRGLLNPRDQVVCVAGMEDSRLLDSVVVIGVGDEFEMFLGPDRDDWEHSDLRPDVLQRVIELATELAVEGREGSPIGALFVVGDLPQVLPRTHQMVLNPFHGYPPERRNILDRAQLGETAKEFSTIDGAFLIQGDGTIESVGTHIDSGLLMNEYLPQGLGARHRAAAAITAVTNAIAVALSQSTGNVTVFRKGQIVAEIPKPNVARPPRIGSAAQSAGNGERILIVGGGISGLSIAWRLAEAGLRVTLLEAGALGGGVTTHNQGWLRSGALIAPEDRELAAMTYAAHRRTLEFCPECIESQTNRMLYLFTDPDTRLDDWTDAWRDSGIPCEAVPMPDVARDFPGIDPDAVHAAFRLPDRSIRFDVLLNQLAVMARQAGVRILTDTPVRELLARGDFIRGVLTEDGDAIPGRFVILAADAATETLLSSLPEEQRQRIERNRLTAFKSHLLAMRPGISRVPFCLADRDGFNHLPHDDVSVFHGNVWVAAADPADRDVAPAEIESIRQTIDMLFPGHSQGQSGVVEWVGTTLRGASSETRSPGRAMRPLVLEHEPLRNLISAIPGRATLWPILAEQTRQVVLARLNSTQTSAPPWAALGNKKSP